MKVNLVGFNHSTGRGVGFYTEHLSQALQKKGVEITNKNPDLVHYPFFDLFYSTLRPHSCPTVITIHDLTPLVLPKMYPQGFRAKINLVLQRLAIGNSSVITDSHTSKKDLIRYFHLQDNQISVIPLAIDPTYYNKDTHASSRAYSRGDPVSNLPPKFILYVGGANPNKNLISLAKACEANNIPLVLVGSEFVKKPRETFSFKKLFSLQNTHPENETYQYLAPKIQNGEIIALGFVPTEQLKVIYKKATVYVQPSYYEGFGLSLLEAMASKCLTLSSNQGSLSELKSDNSLIFEPFSQASLNQELKNALDLKEFVREKIVASQFNKSKEYSWDLAAEQTLSVYKSLLK
jgi:alpha-1,3-rhamnosyl/mannosyltransferase